MSAIAGISTANLRPFVSQTLLHSMVLNLTTQVFLVVDHQFLNPEMSHTQYAHKNWNQLPTSDTTIICCLYSQDILCLNIFTFLFEKPLRKGSIT